MPGSTKYKKQEYRQTHKGYPIMPSSMKSKEPNPNGPTEKKRVSLVVDEDDEDEEPQEQQQVETDPENNSKRRRKKKKNGRKSTRSAGSADPAGYVSSHHSRGLTDESLYENQELNPLSSSKRRGGSSGLSPLPSSTSNGSVGNSSRFDALNSIKSLNDDDEDIEEEALFDDTFTFLMTAKYPLEDCWQKCCKGKDDDDTDEETEKMKVSKSMRANLTSTKIFKEHTDPDKWCLPFWLGTFVIISQFFIYTIVMGRLFQNRIPPNADPWLRMAQIFAVIVTLYTQSDFIDGIFLLTERWKAFAEISGPIKFNLHAICRIVAGNIGIASTFLLVMYSEEVVDLLLNFTAMEFVATLDDSAFELASKGFLGGTLERKADIIRSFRYHPRHRRRRRHSRLCLFLGYFVLIFTAFFAIIFLQGKRSVGIDNEVYIQFDDSRPLESLSGISGVYKGCKGFATSDTGDIGYIDISLECPNLPKKQAGKEIPERSFVYCRTDLDGWVYVSESTMTPCDKGSHLLRSFLDEDSIPAHAFDILVHSKANWVYTKPDHIGGEAELTNFAIGPVSSIPSEFVFCEGDGLVRTDKDEKLQRPFNPLPLESFYYPIFDRENPDATEGEIYPAVFGQIYRPLFVRPVHEERSDGNKFQVILYDGLRWHRMYLNPSQFARNITRYNECGDDPQCWRVFMKYFHSERSWRANSTVAFFDKISDPVMILSPTDNGVPTDEELVWYEARVDDNGIVLPDRIVEPDFADKVFGLRCKVEFDLGCGNEETEFRIDFGTDSFPSENSLFAFFGQGDEDIAKLDIANRIFAEPGATEFSIPENGLVDFRFSENNNLHVFSTCVPAETPCIQIIVADEFGDGVNARYEFSFSGDEARGGNDNQLWNCRLYQLGSGCTNRTQSDETGLIECNIDTILDNYPDIVIGGEIRVGPTADEFIGNTIAVTPLPTLPDDYYYYFIGYDTSEPMFELICDENEIGLQFDVTTDWCQYDTQIGVFFGQGLDTADGLETFETLNYMTPISREGQFEMSSDAVSILTFPWAQTSYAFGTCIPAETPCIQVVLTDYSGSGISTKGFTITYGDEISVGANDDDFSFWPCRLYQFGGPGCVNTLDMIPAECDASDWIYTIAPEATYSYLDF